MKKMILTGLILSSVIAISACQKGEMDNDTAKIQESIEKIKTRIQENLSNEKASTSESQSKEKTEQKKNPDSTQDSNEPKSSAD